MNPRITKKERGLIKGALRRVFSRSDLRREAVQKSVVADFVDPSRPRVKRWSRCPRCRLMIPTYQMEVDHKNPIVPVDKSFDEMVFDEVVDNLWCPVDNLTALCGECHDKKTKLENAERRKNKKGKR